MMRICNSVVLSCAAFASSCERAPDLLPGFTRTDELTLADHESLPAQRIDLVELFPAAAKGSEIAHIELEPGAGQPYLGSGWAGCGADAASEFTWALGERSELTLPLGHVRPLRLRFECLPLGFSGAPEAWVEFEIDGVPVARVVLERRWRSYTVELPAERLRKGFNRIGLRYAYHRRPMDVIESAADARSLSVAWASIEIVDGRKGSPPRVETSAEGPTLTLPRGSWVDYHVMLPAESVLFLGDCSQVGDAHLRLEVEVERDDPRSEVLLVSVEPDGEGPRALRIPGARDGLARVSLRAVPTTTDADPTGALRIVRPELRYSEPEKVAPQNLVEGPRPERPLLVLVYLVDTLRADHLGCYGYSRPTSPHIDAFAADATRFARTQAQAPWTRPAVASLFTGLYARAHGINEILDKIPDSMDCMAEAMKSAGYRTVGIVTNPNVTPAFGFDQGFDYYEYLDETSPVEVEAQSDAVNEAAFAQLAAWDREQPLFLYLHTVDPHGPYTPRSPYRERFAPDVDDPRVGSPEQQEELRTHLDASPELIQDLVNLYDAEIAQNDASFGELIDRLKQLGVYDRSAIVFLSDHGEAFFEHGNVEHGTTLHQEELSVPLIVRFPGGIGRGVVEHAIARQIDILPTLLDLVGAAHFANAQGRSLLPFAVGGSSTPEDSPPAYSYLLSGPREAECVVTGEHKLIHPLSDLLSLPKPRLFDLESDPLEMQDLSAARPLQVGHLLSMLRFARHLWGRADEADYAEIDEELESKLRALGYF